MVRLTDRPDMTLYVYRGRKTTIQPTNQPTNHYPIRDVFEEIYTIICFDMPVKCVLCFKSTVKNFKPMPKGTDRQIKSIV